MKYLLSILILFSGLSFSSKYSDEDIFLLSHAPYNDIKRDRSMKTFKRFPETETY